MSEHKTENGAASFDSTTSSCLDFYGTICRTKTHNTKRKRSRHISNTIITQRIDELLPKMWQENPLYTLKLIFHKRDCREGAGEKSIFYHCYDWLLKNHPETAYKNLHNIHYYGYWKDYLNLLTLPDTQENKTRNQTIAKLFAFQLKKDQYNYNNFLCKEHGINKGQTNLDIFTIVIVPFLIVIGSSMYLFDYLPYRIVITLYSILFFWTVYYDLWGNKSNKSNKSIGDGKVSLCAKWAPTNKLFFDKKYKICKLIAKELGFDDNWQVQYRKLLTPLRNHLNVAEQKMCSKDWNDIKLDNVPSICMNRNKTAFQKNMPEKFTDWIERIKTGKGKVNSKQLMVHELITSKHLDNELTQHQWDSLRESIKAKGSLKGVIPVGDLSGSMSGTPMDVSIGLSIMISELAEPPFDNTMITFSENPTFYKFEGKSLKEKVETIHRSGSIGYNTNIMKVFEIVLEKCIENKVDNENMPTKILILTDGQFDAQTTDNDKTCFENIRKMYRKHGYSTPVLVLWNLRGDVDNVPVTQHETGTILISGWSTNLLKSVIDATDMPTPMEVMLKTLNNERYDRLIL